MFQHEDQRGRHNNRPNKLSDEGNDFLKSHLHSIPKVESHYCRSGTKRQYFADASLRSIAQLHRLYVEASEKQNPPIDHLKIGQYSHVFNTQFNLGFRKPMKDRCAKCEQFENANNNKKV